MKTLLMLVIILGMISCDKEKDIDVDYSISWHIQSVDKELIIKELYRFNDGGEGSMEQNLPKGSSKVILKKSVDKLEIRCGECKFTVNGRIYTGDTRFYPGGGEEYIN